MMTLSHPKGMYVLAMTEVFERLSFYTLSFLLVLYASSPISEHGLGWSKANALTLGGLYTLAAYIFPIFGSLIADKYLGHFRSILFGGAVIMIGHFCMLFSANINILYLALFLIASGTAFFKPCIPALLGNLYKWNDPRRESGYCWYYCGINLGIMLAGVIGGLLLQQYGYHIALTSAGFGMAIGISLFYFGRKYLVFNSAKSVNLKIIVPKMTQKQSKALYMLILSIAFFALWAVIYNLSASGTLSLFIEHHTHKTVFNYNIPVTFFSALEGLTIMITTPIITYFLARRSLKNRYPHFFSQMNFALFVCVCGLFYFTLLTLKFDNQAFMPKPFQYYEIALFLIIFSVSETIINPVIMSAISIIAPQNYKSFFQSIYLSCYGITGLIAAKIGSYAIEKPFYIYLSITIFMAGAAIIFFFIKPKMIEIVNAAHQEKKNTLKQSAA
ncbi:peptide MFS transporter [Fluviispira multicolorata]|nr:oligopeptide:H+ symporter [Fluviispira multicolorata]